MRHEGDYLLANRSYWMLGGARATLAANASALIFSLIACVPGSRLYKPLSGLESKAHSQANRSIFPGDVRENPSKYEKQQVAWTGLVRNVQVERSDALARMHLTVQHHYYDWIENLGPQPQRIFLSPNGEGSFKTTWDLSSGFDGTKAEVQKGDMVIVYGYPKQTGDGALFLESQYIRLIRRQWVTTTMLTYGRDGS